MVLTKIGNFSIVVQSKNIVEMANNRVGIAQSSTIWPKIAGSLAAHHRSNLVRKLFTSTRCNDLLKRKSDTRKAKDQPHIVKVVKMMVNTRAARILWTKLGGRANAV